MNREIQDIYIKIQDTIKHRLDEFKDIWENGNDEDLFKELAFCLLTPQSKAVSCWECVNILSEKGLLLKGDADALQKEIKGYARFHNTKAKRIVEAREKYMNGNKFALKNILDSIENVFEKRKYLVDNIKGYGYKEASHFMRNIGFGKDIAILDRHIYKNLKNENIISEIPKSITPAKYKEIEAKMREHAEKINIPMHHLDFVLWYKEAGEVFK